MASGWMLEHSTLCWKLQIGQKIKKPAKTGFLSILLIFEDHSELLENPLRVVVNFAIIGDCRHGSEPDPGIFGCFRRDELDLLFKRVVKEEFFVQPGIIA